MIALIGFLVIIITGVLWAKFSPNTKRIYLSITATVLLSSCMTTGRIARNCDKFLQVCGTPVQTWIEYRDTVVKLDPIPVRLPQSDINVNLQLQVKDNQVNLQKQSFTQGLISVEVEVVNNHLQVKAWLNDSTVLAKPDPVVIPKAIREEKKKEVVVISEVKWYHKWSVRIVETLILILLIYFGRKLSWGNLLTKILSVLPRRGA